MILLGVVKRVELVKLLSTAKRNEKLVKEQNIRANFAHFNQINTKSSISEFISDINSDTRSYFNGDEEKQEEEEKDEEFILPDEFEIDRYSSFPLTNSADNSETVSLVEPNSEYLPTNDVDIWNQNIPFLFKAHSDVASDFADMVVVDPAPFQIGEQVAIAKIHFIFTMLGLREICVTQRGRLMGLITKNNLLSVLQ